MVHLHPGREIAPGPSGFLVWSSVLHSTNKRPALCSTSLRTIDFDEDLELFQQHLENLER